MWGSAAAAFEAPRAPKAIAHGERLLRLSYKQGNRKRNETIMLNLQTVYGLVLVLTAKLPWLSVQNAIFYILQCNIYVYACIYIC